MNAQELINETDLLLAIQRVRDGAPDEFELIHCRYIATVQNLCRCKLHTADRCIHYEEDLASEIMLTLWMSIRDQRYQWSSTDELWHAILRLIKNRTFNRARNNRRKKRCTLLDLAALYRELYGHLGAAGNVAQVDAEDAFEAFFQRLPDRESKELISLKRIGLTNDTIADQLKVNVRTIQRRLEILGQVFDNTFALQGVT